MLSPEGVELRPVADMVFRGIYCFSFVVLRVNLMGIVLRDLLYRAASLVYEVLLLPCARDLCWNT